MNTRNRIIVSGLCIILILLFAVPGRSQSTGCVKLLNIEKEGGKNKLAFNLDDLNAIVNGFNLKDNSAAVEFLNANGLVITELGKVKKGNINWGHKVSGSSLIVKLKKEHYDPLLEQVEAQAAQPGYTVQASLSKKAMSRQQTYGQKTKYVQTSTIYGACDITFVVSPDLTVLMKYPVKAKPAESLTDKITITLENKGTIAAKNVKIQLVISTDIDIPTQTASFSASFKEDSLLEGGEKIIEVIQPGEQVQFNFKGSLKIPSDTTPGRYYLAAVIDPENEIKELNEINNKDVRFFMVSVPTPAKWTLELSGCKLVYRPKGFMLNVYSHDAIVSCHREWRKCQIKPSIHQIKHAAWQPFLWEVDTIDRAVWQVTNVKFCKKGGNAKEVKMKVDVMGGTETLPPTEFVLHLADARLEYEPKPGKFRILAFGNQIAYIPFWRCMQVQGHLYHLKHELWKDFFWEIDTFKNEVSKVTGRPFGQDAGGAAQKLDIVLKTE